MDTTNNTKKILFSVIFFIIIILLIVLYFMFFKKDEITVKEQNTNLIDNRTQLEKDKELLNSMVTKERSEEEKKADVKLLDSLNNNKNNNDLNLLNSLNQKDKIKKDQNLLLRLQNN